MTQPADVSTYAPEPGKVAIRDPDGSVWKIPQEQLGEAQHEGARPATEAEYFGAERGRPGEAASAAIGLGRGLTFGLSDRAVVEAGDLIGGQATADEVRHTLNLAREANPQATFGGEVAGAVAPMFFGGGAAKGGLSLVERGLGTTAAEAGGLARAGIRAAEAAPRAFGEGAAIGAGQQLSEDTLSNHKLIGENYLTAGVKGGAIGLILGAATTAGLGHVADKSQGLFGRPVAEAVEQAGLREENTAYRTAAHVEEEAAGKGRVGKWLDAEPNIQSFKGATGAKTTDFRRLGADVEAQEARAGELGATLRREATSEGQPLVGPLVSQAESAKRIAARTEEVGKELASLRKHLDASAERPSLSAIQQRFESEVAAPALKMPGGERDIAAAQDYLTGMFEKGGERPSFETLHAYRRKLDDQLATNYSRIPGMTNPPGEESLRALRGIVEDEFTTAGERAAREFGDTFADKYKLTKSLYRDLATVKKIATHQAALNSGSNAWSITDAIAASTGGLPGFVAAGANMVRRKLGNQIAAHVLDKAARMESIQGAATRIDDALSKGAKAFVADSKIANRTTKTATAAEIRAIRDATASPDVIQARVADALGDLPAIAPKVASAVSAAANRAAAWLQHTLPKEPPPVGPQFGPRTPRPLSDSERLQAQHVIETVEDPTIVLDRLRQGRLTDDHVRTLKYVHPETYAKIQSYLTEHAAEIRPTLTVQQQVSLSILFGEPISAAMLPENVRALQASFSQGNQAPGTGGGGGVPPSMNAGPMKGGGSRATIWDKQESGQ